MNVRKALITAHLFNKKRGVSSVNGKTGEVVLTPSDIDLSSYADRMWVTSQISAQTSERLVVTLEDHTQATLDVVIKLPYLCFTAEASNSELALTSVGTPSSLTLEQSSDGKSWIEYTAGNTITLLNAGEKVYLRGNNSSFSTGVSKYWKFSITGKVSASGNVMSLADKTCASTVIPSTFFFNSLFRDCIGLTSAPELPATTLTNYCYRDMFYGCTGLTSAPELPATTLTTGCYYEMFRNCTGLTSAPELPATTLSDMCYLYMFYGCTGLTSAPELPATTIAESCYSSMFNGCTGLTSAPELPATTLASQCYGDMFRNCTGLTSAPELPATTLASQCYLDMFYGCTGLTSAPELPATTLTNQCYTGMFHNCTSISSIRVAFHSFGENTATWVTNVAQSGVFYCPPDLPDERGGDKVPTGWTIVRID